MGLPAGTAIQSWKSINSSGVIAAIGNGGHALLLLPVEFSVTNVSTVRRDFGWIPPELQLSPTFEIVGKVPNILGLPIQGDIKQDIQAGRIMKFSDDSLTRCIAPEYYPDEAPIYNDVVVGSEGRFTTFKFTDNPKSPLTTDARFHLTSCRYIATDVRDFLIVKLGNQDSQTVAEVKWSVAMLTTFIAHEPHRSTLDTDSVSPIPAGGMSIDGRTSTDLMINDRGYTANMYVSDSNHWSWVGAPGSYGQTYCVPLK